MAGRQKKSYCSVKRAKTIDGKKYMADRLYTSRSDAEAYARELRGSVRDVRIAPSTGIQGGSGFAVYTHKGRTGRL